MMRGARGWIEEMNVLMELKTKIRLNERKQGIMLMVGK